MAEDQGSEHASIRDVYELVDRSRKETTEQIGALSERFETFAQANEHRLSVVETHQAAQAQQMSEVSSRLDKHNIDIGNLKESQKASAAADAAIEEKSRTDSNRHIALTGAAAAIAAALATLFNRIHFH